MVGVMFDKFRAQPDLNAQLVGTGSSPCERSSTNWFGVVFLFLIYCFLMWVRWILRGSGCKPPKMVDFPELVPLCKKES